MGPTGKLLTKAGAALVALIAALGVWSGTATAAGPAGPGSTFSTSALELPEGAIPGGAGGYFQDSAVNSPLSSNGRYMAFASDTNSMSEKAHPDVTNVFRKDRTTGAVEFISRASGDAEGPAFNSGSPRISGDGNLIAFSTEAPLVPADADTTIDVYLRNVSSGETSLITPGTTLDVNQFDLSADGEFLAFTTTESLVPGDLGSNSDAYRRDLVADTNALVSRNHSSVNSANDDTFEVSISNDGTWVAFSSTATDLVNPFVPVNAPFDTDVFVRDMSAATTYLVSSKHNSALTGGNGASQEPDISGTPTVLNDVKVGYSTYATDVGTPGEDTEGNSSVFLRDFPATPSILISRATGAGASANSRAHTPAVSDNGNIVGFSSDAGNLGAGANYYGTYSRNVFAATTNMVSADNDYAVQAAVSGDGSTMSWLEYGATPDSDPVLPEVFTRAIPSGPVRLSSRPPGNQRFLFPGIFVFSSSPGSHQISDDGRYTILNGVSSLLPEGEKGHLYRRDNQTGALDLVSRATGASGAPSENGAGAGSISGDGSKVAFVSYSPLVAADDNTVQDVYVRDFEADTTTLVTRANGAAGAVGDSASGDPEISGNGNRVAFGSSSTNLGDPAGKSQVYVRDRVNNQTIIASRAAGVAGVIGDGSSSHGRISSDGQVVVFDSNANNLHSDDPDTTRDIFVRDLSTNTLLLASRLNGLTGAKSAMFSYNPAISGDGKVIAYETEDETIAPEGGSFGGHSQIVSRVLATGVNNLVSGSPGTVAGNLPSSEASLDDDGSRIAFHSRSTNLLASVAMEDRGSVYVRDLENGTLTAPPGFGTAQVSGYGSRLPSISRNGNCLAFNAAGFNAASGDASDNPGTYVHVLSGTCLDPLGTPVPPDPPELTAPVLSKVSLKPKKFAVGKKPTAKVAVKKAKKRKSPKGTKIRFTLDKGASVTIRIDRKVAGRKVKGKCRKLTKGNKRKKKCVRLVKTGKLVRGDQAAGNRVVPFSGRIGKKKLKPGKYLASITAYNSAGGSKTFRKPFRVVRR